MNAPMVSYRAAQDSDAADCIDLRGRTRENPVSVARLRELGITVQSWREGIESGQYIGVVCLYREELVGYCFGHRDTGEVLVLALLPSFEGHGIGRTLLTHVVRALGGLGHQRLFLGTSVNPSVRSYGFYRHLGWQATGRIDRNGDEILELYVG